MLYLASAVVAYFLGSIPWGYLAGKLKGVDLHKEGSGSTGATNALRVLGKSWGYTVFALDALKGSLAVIAAFQISERFFAATPA
ncbi:MAG: glycerol-3-phosphate acyltransferase, partial [Spartobacteria bacterium]